MKKYILFLLLFASISVNAQTVKGTSNDRSAKYEQMVDSLLSKIDTLLMINNNIIEQMAIDAAFKDRYRLYPTENIYNFLQLDTKTGRIEQVQWSLKTENEGSVTINDEDLSSIYGSSDFELYPTKNMYQFILIDKVNGKKWHVQWGMKDSERWIRRIY